MTRDGTRFGAPYLMARLPQSAPSSSTCRAAEPTAKRNGSGGKRHERERHRDELSDL